MNKGRGLDRALLARAVKESQGVNADNSLRAVVAGAVISMI